jgi:anti-anti-sigma regulatory factor
MLTITVAGGATATDFRLTGSLEASSVEKVRAAYRDRSPAAEVSLDLRGLTAMDRPGLGAILGLIRAAREVGATVTVQCSDEVCDTLVDEGVERLIGLGRRPSFPRTGRRRSIRSPRPSRRAPDAAPSISTTKETPR